MGSKTIGMSKQRNRQHNCVSLVFLGSQLKILKVFKRLLNVGAKVHKVCHEGNKW